MDFLAVNNFGDTRSGGLAGPMGLFIIVLMSIATVLLVRNMNKRLRRLPDSFPINDASKRDGEINRADATAADPGTGPGSVGVDAGRSGAGGADEQAQVSAPDPTGRPGGAGSGPTGA